MKNLDLVYAFSLLIQEELQTILPGWTIIDMGRAPDDPDSLEDAGFQVHSAGHFFRVQVTINSSGLIRAEFPWERVYVGKAHVVLSVYYSHRDLALHDVCGRICWHVDDPKCQEGLAERLYRAFGIYLMTQKKLPDH